VRFCRSCRVLQLARALDLLPVTGSARNDANDKKKGVTLVSIFWAKNSIRRLTDILNTKSGLSRMSGIYATDHQIGRRSRTSSIRVFQRNFFPFLSQDHVELLGVVIR
jgi:hypothetical protein